MSHVWDEKTGNQEVWARWFPSSAVRSAPQSTDFDLIFWANRWRNCPNEKTSEKFLFFSLRQHRQWSEQKGRWWESCRVWGGKIWIHTETVLTSWLDWEKNRGTKNTGTKNWEPKTGTRNTALCIAALGVCCPRATHLLNHYRVTNFRFRAGMVFFCWNQLFLLFPRFCRGWFLKASYVPFCAEKTRKPITKTKLDLLVLHFSWFGLIVVILHWPKTLRIGGTC